MDSTGVPKSVTHDALTEEPETTMTERKDAKCHFILLSIILSFPHEKPQVDKASSHFIMGQGIKGFITEIVRTPGSSVRPRQAPSFDDPRTGASLEKRRSF